MKKTNMCYRNFTKDFFIIELNSVKNDEKISTYLLIIEKIYVVFLQINTIQLVL